MVGVSAQPLPNDMFTWHGNIKAPEGSQWKGVVLHFEMNIPRDYPVSPPSIKLFNTIPHPNIFGSTLCLDMTQSDSKGWSVAYTIESVLIQLQSFLFHAKKMNDEKEDEKQAIKNIIEKANDFQCEMCRHKGPL